MDKQKADQTITEYLQKIYGFAMKKSFSYDEAQDICSDIISELYVSLLKADEVYNLECYVWRICEHVYAKYVSSKKKHQGVSIDGMIIPFEDSYNFGDTEDQILRLRREVAFLTQTRREIVYAFYYEGKSIAQISSVMQIPDGTVKWHLNKARNDLKKGFNMDRKIGKLGIKPIKDANFGHNGNPGSNGGPEFYLSDNVNLNIVYSVYYTPRTKEEIAEELGVTPAIIEEKVDFLEQNGFLVRQPGNKFTTYVKFSPETYSLEMHETIIKKKLEIARQLVQEYVPMVRKAISEVNAVYIPGENRELLEAAAIFYAISNKCGIAINKDLSKYSIKTTDGGEYFAFVGIPSEQRDKDYKPTLNNPSYWACGNMNRWSEKYPVYSWSMDTKYCSRQGRWQNNLTSDYEYLYEFMTGAIIDNRANADKFNRLREREFITKDNKVNIMVMKGIADEFFAKIPPLDEEFKKKFAGYALEAAELEARDYPPQMRDLVISHVAGMFISNDVGVMVMDVLYGDGIFKELTDNEKVTSHLIMFCDTLPK